MNKAVLYTRVSSDEQRKSGYSLDYQKKQGEEYAQKKELNIVKIFSESYTAKKPGRPMFNEMLKYVKKNKISHIIFLKSDRASRNGVDSAQLVYMAERDMFNIHLIQDGLCLNSRSKPTDFLIFEISNCMSNFYPRNLSIDVSTKMREKAEQGYYPSHAPVGYSNVRIRKRSYLQINPEKAPFIIRAFELYSTGQYSYESLAKQLRQEGFFISKTVKCGKSNIEDILNNPIYIGDFVWNGQRYFNAKHKPIISRELYNACQQIIKERSTGKGTKHDFIYSNLLKCKKCGCYLVGEIKKGKYIYYHCTGNKGGNCKKGSYIREEKIEASILEVLNKFYLSEETLELVKKCFKEEITKQNSYNEQRLKKLEENINKQKSRLNKLFNLYLDGEVEQTLYKKKSVELEQELEELSLEYSSITKTGVEILKYSNKLFELFKNAKELYFQLDNKKKRELLKLLCSNFYYDGENVIITIKKAFQPLVKIAYLEKLEQKRQSSNFLDLIKSFIELIKDVEFVTNFEKFFVLKQEFSI